MAGAMYGFEHDLDLDDGPGGEEPTTLDVVAGLLLPAGIMVIFLVLAVAGR